MNNSVTKREEELRVLLSLSDQDLVREMEKEINAEGIVDEGERRFILRFMNLARKGAGMPEVAVQ